MITTCTRQPSCRSATAIVSGLDAVFAPGPARVNGFFAPPRPAPPPSRRYQSTGYRAKKLLLGPALKTSQLSNERVSKRVALAVFSSDPISSTAYATEEMLLVLVGAALATRLALPVALAIVVPLALLVDYVLTVAVSVSSGVVAVGAMVAAGLWRLAGRDIELSPDPCRGSSLPPRPPKSACAMVAPPLKGT